VLWTATKSASGESLLTGGRPVRIGIRSHAEALVQFSRYLDAVVVAAIFAWVLDPRLRRTRLEFLATILIVPCWMSMLRYFGLYESHRIEGIRALVRDLLSAQFFGGLLAGSVGFLLWGWAGLTQIGAFLAATTAILLAQKALMRVVLTELRRRGLDHRRICIIGNRSAAREIAAECQRHPGWGLDVGCVGLGAPEERKYYSFPDYALLGSDLEEILCTEVVDEVLIAVDPTEPLAQERAIINLCGRYGILGRLVPLPLVPEISDADVSDFHGNVSFGIGGLRQNGFEVALKRWLDVVAGSVLLILCLPVMAVAALFVKLSSRGPIFFVQDRVGLRGRRFRMYKFRSMFHHAESLTRTRGEPSDIAPNIARGPILVKTPRDYRVTPIGRVLRRFSIDELPQLWNVIQGEMSLVGPRPLPLSEAQAISGAFRKRFSMRPGITCLWQVSGRSELGYQEWMDYDLQYIDNWSLGLDMRLILRTVPAVLAGRGAY
jgi:exopolysaccharide biosynthesis polyprenyl glycosylphosphotransferase